MLDVLVDDADVDSCPRIALRAETRMINMQHRIWQHKLILINLIKCQNMSSLSRRIFDEQKTNNLPGLCSEVRDICVQLNTPDLNENTMSEVDIKRAT